LAGAIALGLLLPWAFLGVLGLYYALTLSYSLRLRDLVIVDVLALAGLHALRVLAGSAATGIPPSAWLIAFCVFLFFSLAMIKRYAELVVMRTVDGGHAHARAYEFETASCSPRSAAPAATWPCWYSRSTSARQGAACSAGAN
jgi:hypothetical protein